MKVLDLAAASFRRAIPVADFLFWSKARPTLLSCLAAWIGMALTHPRFAQSRDGAWAMVAVFLIGSGANAWNEFLEVHEDRKMHRTMDRPLPAGRISPFAAFLWSALVSFAGLGILLSFSRLAALTGILILVSYVGFYTPLKRFSPLSFFVGAAGGALPPFLGGALTAPTAFPWAALWMTALLYCWQLPHFVAISRLHAEDYERGNLKVLGGKQNSPFLPIRFWLYMYLPAFIVAALSVMPYLAPNHRQVLPPVLLSGASLLFLAAIEVFRRANGHPAAARLLLKLSVAHLALILITVGQFNPF